MTEPEEVMLFDGYPDPEGFGKPSRRHPLEVTADRLRDHYERYYDKLGGAERDDLSHLIWVFQEIAEGNR